MGPGFLAFAAVFTFGDPTHRPPAVRPTLPIAIWSPARPPSPSAGALRFDETAAERRATVPILPSEPYSRPIWRGAESLAPYRPFGLDRDTDFILPGRIEGCSF